MTSGSENHELAERSFKKLELLAKTKLDVQHILNYQIENSCDEKLLKLVANRVKVDKEVRQTELAEFVSVLGKRGS